MKYHAPDDPTVSAKGRGHSRRHNAPSPHGPSLGNLSKIAKTRQLHDLIKESARGRHWTIASSNSTQTQVELNAETVKRSPRRADLEPSRRESTGVDRNRVARRAAPCQATSLMKISTSLGAILHKPDWNLHKPGSDSPQARSPRSTHPPRFVPKTFSFAYPTFRLPLPTFRKPGNVSSAAKASRAGEMRRTGKFDSRRLGPSCTHPAASRRPLRRFHRNRPTAPLRRFHRNRPTAPPRGGFIETALPCESIHSP